MKKSDQTVLLSKIPVFSSQKSELLESLSQKVIRTKKLAILFTPNPEQLVLARKNPSFHADLLAADYRIADGIGVVWASRILRWFGRSKAIAERISGVDLVSDLLDWAAREKWRVLLIGGKGYEAGTTRSQSAAVQLVTSSAVPHTVRLHWLAGYDNVGAPTTAETAVVEKTIRSLKPQLVFVAFGAPHQERWVIQNQKLLQQSGTKVVMVVGGAFDILLGSLRRAPAWMRALGLEWLYRLFQEPWRWRRQLALLKFASQTAREALGLSE